MRFSIRLLTPEKKGIGKRISAAVESAGGKVQEIRATRRMRGMSETMVVVAAADAQLRKPIIDALGQVAGIAILSSQDGPTA